MKYLLLALSFLLIGGDPWMPLAWGRVRVLDVWHVKNESPGYCAWASIEICCWHQDVAAGYYLMERRKADPDDVINGEVYEKNFGYDITIRKKLDSLGIRYRMASSLNQSEYGRRIIREGLANDRPVVIAYQVGRNGHAVVVVDFDEREGTWEYIDPNHPGYTWTQTMDWFNQHWTGLALEIER